MAPDQPLPPAGWYPDPDDPTQQRRWNGSQWTDDRRATQPGQPPPPQPQGGTVYVERTSNGFAVVALVCGIIGAVLGLIPILFILAWALGIVALVFGILARRRTKRDPAVGRRGMATAGVVLGIVAFGLGVAGYAIVNDAFEDVDDELDRIEQEFEQTSP